MKPRQFDRRKGERRIENIAQRVWDQRWGKAYVIPKKDNEAKKVKK